MGVLSLAIQLALIVIGIYVLVVETTTKRKLLGLIPLGAVVLPFFVGIVIGIAMALSGNVPAAHSSTFMVMGLVQMALQIAVLAYGVRLVSTAKTNRALAYMARSD